MICTIVNKSGRLEYLVPRNSPYGQKRLSNKRERAGKPHRALFLDKFKEKETVGDSHLGKNNDSVTICYLNREK